MPNIYLRAGEDVCITYVGTGGNDNTASRFRSGWARGSMSVTQNSGSADPPANRITTGTFDSAQSNFWLHFQALSSGSTTVSGQQALIMRSPDGVSRLLLRQTGNTNELKLSKRNSAGTITDLATFTSTWTGNTLYKVDIDVSYAVSGHVNIYFNSTLFCTYTGDTTTDSATQINAVEFATWSSINPNYYSEIIVSDTDTRTMGLFSMVPLATGVDTGWTTTTVGNINKLTISDSTFINSATANQVVGYTQTAVPAGSYNVLELSVWARADKGASGPTQLQAMFRPGSGSTDNFGSTVALTSSFVNYKLNVWTVNPNNSQALVIADISTSTNIGLKSIT